jgi:hypothetical protein
LLVEVVAEVLMVQVILLVAVELEVLEKLKLL